MTWITRRQVLRWLGGVSVLGALGQGVGAVTKPGADLGTQSLSLGEPGLAGPPESSSSTLGAYRAGLGATGTNGHESHVQSSAAPSTTEPLTTTATAASSTTDTAAVGSPTTTDTAAVSSPTTTETNSHDTTSTAPPVAVGTIELSGVIPSTMVAKGQVATIVGHLELGGDLVVEGVLTGISTFILEGNGHQIEVRNGGQVDLQGVPKSGWVRGVNPNGWQRGDRILVAPVGAGRYGASDFYAGSPETTGLADGRTIAAEQFNLTRSIVINNVSRLMFHMGAGRQVLRHLAVTNSGVTGQIGFYPIHFHMNGDTTRGSIVEGVVVENGRFHAFVPHASHGVTFLDCVAFNTEEHAYWWDGPPSDGDTSNDTRDVVWHHCLAALVTSSGEAHRLAGFVLGASSGNRCIDSTALGVQGGKHSSGFVWPEKGHGEWEFRGCVAHNNKSNGILVWQNTALQNRISEFIAYRCGRAGIEHGAYVNNYKYVNVSLTDTRWGVVSHALSAQDGLLFENVISDTGLLITDHSLPSSVPVVYRSCRFPNASIQETLDGESEPGLHEFIDTGLLPATIDVSAIHRGSFVRITEAGRVLWEWAGGRWNQL